LPSKQPRLAHVKAIMVLRLDFDAIDLFGFLKSKYAISEYNAAASIIGKIVIA
jgi:hypothetical protein